MLWSGMGLRGGGSRTPATFRAIPVLLKSNDAN